MSTISLFVIVHTIEHVNRVCDDGIPLLVG